ncbi:MAG TPA: RNA-binding protein [Bacteroidia bacterium]|nr:RNA-binding protein [Bacteroidia bacterium]
MELYLSNLPFTAQESDLQPLCEAFGAVTRVHIVRDKPTGRSKGFAFVEMPDRAQGEAAIAGLNGKEFMGREMKAREAMPKR